MKISYKFIHFELLLHDKKTKNVRGNTGTAKKAERLNQNTQRKHRSCIEPPLITLNISPS